MVEIYWACLFLGITGAVVAVLFDDVIDALLGALHPLPLLGGTTVFGTAGLILSNYLGMEANAAALPAIGIAVLISALLHFVVVRPMRRAESSLGYSMTELPGKMGEVTVPIPSTGYGEVRVDVGRVPTFQIAGSFNGENVPGGTSVVVVEVREGAVYVTPFSVDEAMDSLNTPADVPPH